MERERRRGNRSGKVRHNNTGNLLKTLLCNEVIYYSQYVEDRAVYISLAHTRTVYK
jgi:hypothetical protein